MWLQQSVQWKRALEARVGTLAITPGELEAIGGLGH